jgi:hypothetical protein
VLQKCLLDVLHSLVQLRDLGPIETLLYEVLVVVLMMLLLHELPDKVDLLQLPIGYNSIDLVFDEIPSLLLLDNLVLSAVV